VTLNNQYLYKYHTEPIEKIEEEAKQEQPILMERGNALGI